jgi:hypothetical protein
MTTDLKKYLIIILLISGCNIFNNKSIEELPIEEIYGSWAGKIEQQEQILPNHECVNGINALIFNFELSEDNRDNDLEASGAAYLGIGCADFIRAHYSDYTTEFIYQYPNLSLKFLNFRYEGEVFRIKSDSINYRIDGILSIQGGTTPLTVYK